MPLAGTWAAPRTLHLQEWFAPGQYFWLACDAVATIAGDLGVCKGNRMLAEAVNIAELWLSNEDTSNSFHGNRRPLDSANNGLCSTWCACDRRF